jgi:hypothetical protein
VGLALALWPLLYAWIGERVKARMVYVDEKWLKIRGRWHYWFVVLDVDTEVPVLATIVPKRSPWACRWIGRQLRRLQKVPWVIITDGLQTYTYLVPRAKHVVCRFHHQQSVTHWLQQHCATEAAINARKPVMEQLLQTRDKRTVRRRLARLQEPAPALGIMPWVNRVEAKLPALICSVGSARGAANAAVPLDQRPLRDAPGASTCQEQASDGRLAPAPSGCSLDAMREIQATFRHRALTRGRNSA